MALATAQVRTTARQTDSRSIPVYLADGYSFFTGTVLCLGADGYCRPATASGAGTEIAGILMPKFGNVASQGEIVTVSGQLIGTEVVVGVFDLPQDGTVTQSHVGGTIYLANDHEVTTSSSSSISLDCVALNSDGSVQVLIAFNNLVQ